MPRRKTFTTIVFPISLGVSLALMGAAGENTSSSLSVSGLDVSPVVVTDLARMQN